MFSLCCGRLDFIRAVFAFSCNNSPLARWFGAHNSNSMDMLDAIQSRKHNAQRHKSVSIQKLRTRVEKLEKNLLPTPEKKSCAWNNLDGTFNCDGRHFKNKKCFDKYVAREKYTVMRTLSWKPPTHKLNLNSQNPNDA